MSKVLSHCVGERVLLTLEETPAGGLQICGWCCLPQRDLFTLSPLEARDLYRSLAKIVAALDRAIEAEPGRAG